MILEQVFGEKLKINIEELRKFMQNTNTNL